MASPAGERKPWKTLRAASGHWSQGIGITIIHEEPEDLLVETVCWSPGGGVLPHDHKTWGCVVGIDGAEKNVTWLRKDDGQFAARVRVDNDGVIAPPIAKDGLLYVYGRGGELVALRVRGQ